MLFLRNADKNAFLFFCKCECQYFSLCKFASLSSTENKMLNNVHNMSWGNVYVDIKTVTFNGRR